MVTVNVFEFDKLIFTFSALIVPGVGDKIAKSGCHYQVTNRYFIIGTSYDSISLYVKTI